MRNIKIGIATHKEYNMPSDDIYMPIEVGAYIENRNLSYMRDNQGDNISEKNPNYCELTAMYWLWKNNESDYKGLVHYRRHFAKLDKFNEFRQGDFSQVLDYDTLNEILNKSDIILPKKRKYYIETLYSHYAHSHKKRDLDETRCVIKELYEDYLPAFDNIMKQRSAHMFNMCIMKKEYFDLYCEWLFNILFELEKRIDISDYDFVEGRVFGYISELLMDVWIEKNGYNYIEVPVMFMEKQNWFIKISCFFYRKIKSVLR